MAGRMNEAEWSAWSGSRCRISSKTSDRTRSGGPRPWPRGPGPRRAWARIRATIRPVSRGRTGWPAPEPWCRRRPDRDPGPTPDGTRLAGTRTAFPPFALVEEAGVAGVVVEDLPVPVFLGGPQVVPQPPVAVIAKVDGQQPVEVGQPLFGQHVERQGRADRVGDAVGLSPKPAHEFVGAGVRLGLEQLGWVPHLPLALVGLHQLADPLLHILGGPPSWPRDPARYR